MKLFWNANLIFTFLITSLAIAAEPALVDLKVIGTVEKPDFEPEKLEFKEGQPYILVIKNDNPFSISFNFDKFGQALSTQYLQGSPNVSQGNLLLLPNSKVIWQFIASKPGEFEYYALNSSYNQPGPKHKINIKPLEDPLDLPSPWQEEKKHKFKALFIKKGD